MNIKWLDTRGHIFVYMVNYVISVISSWMVPRNGSKTDTQNRLPVRPRTFDQRAKGGVMDVSTIYI